MKYYEIPPYHNDERDDAGYRSSRIPRRLYNGQEKKKIYCPYCRDYVNHFHDFPMCRLENELSMKHFFKQVLLTVFNLILIGIGIYLFYKIILAK